MKPIEEGCLAMIIRSVAGNDGKIVRVGKFVGEAPLSAWLRGNDNWEVDPPITASHGFVVSYVRECQLMRIDSDEESNEQFEAEEILEDDVVTIETD